MDAGRRHALVLASALLMTGLVADSVFAHARLLSVKPRQAQTLERSPRAVVLTFNEEIDTEFVRLRVQDVRGARVDTGEPYHPQGREEIVAIRLRPRLDGTFVARYRVLSSDGHPVGRRTTFRVMAGQMQGSGGRKMTPGQKEEEGHADVTGDVTDASFAVVRGLGYLAIALAIGGAVFLLAVWLPSVAESAGAGRDSRAASRVFVARLRRILLGSVVVGLVATALAIVLEAAAAAGVSFWAALDRDTVEPVSDTRAVQAWAVRIVVWLLLGALLMLALRPRRAPVLRRTALGADGAVLAPGLPRTQVLLMAAAGVALALTAPMAGHTGGHSPRGLLVCVDTAHVLCMSMWLGGLVMLLVAVPLGVRTLSAPDRTPLLAGVVGRFSRLAMIAVPLLAATGIVQAVALVGSVDALVDTGYGRLVLAKVGLLVGIVSLGALNQRRSLPRLRALAAGSAEPGRAATVLRRRVATEALLALAVIAVTSTLVATEPPAGEEGGRAALPTGLGSVG